MNPSSLTPISVPFTDDSMKVVAVHWSDSEPTTIEVTSKRNGRIFLVEFEAASGLRILDELDLSSLWSEAASEILKSTWCFQVNAGGWLDLESTRLDFYTQHQGTKPCEYLIGGYQECVSILSLSPPKIHERTESTVPNPSFNGTPNGAR